MKKQTLSDKIYKPSSLADYRVVIQVSDVKEFIKNLKDKIDKTDSEKIGGYAQAICFEIINKLAGKELTGIPDIEIFEEEQDKLIKAIHEKVNILYKRRY